MLATLVRMDPRPNPISEKRRGENLAMLGGSLKVVFRVPPEPCFTDLL